MAIKNGKSAPLPVGSGVGKNPYTGQFTELLPVNVLTVPPKLITEGGFIRGFPGATKIAAVDGVSRGALLNSADAAVYRVCGKKLYRNNKALADLNGADRVSMAGSIKSIAVASLGKMHIFDKDCLRGTLENWPFSEYFPGEQNVLMTGSATLSISLLILTVSAAQCLLPLQPMTAPTMAGSSIKMR